jgi:hypothetical protein
VRPLVETAKRRTKTLFPDLLTREEGDAIRRILKVEPGTFWRACKGRTDIDLPPRWIQHELDFGGEEA